MDIIDKEKINELRELSNGSDDLLKTLLDKYITNTGTFLEQIKGALAAKDYEKVLFGVHTIKGSSLSLGLRKLGEIFTDLNLRAKNGDYNGFEEIINNASNLLNEVVAYRGKLG